jgi:hypothetical protein
MNVVLVAREVQYVYGLGPLCKDCVFHVQKHGILGNYCTKFKSSTLFARMFEQKCGPLGKEFMFKDPIKK